MNNTQTLLMDKIKDWAPFLDEAQSNRLAKLLIPSPQKLHTQPNFTGTVPNYGIFYLDNFPDSPSDYNITWSQIKAQIQAMFGLVTVGPTLGQYPSINAAYTDGNSNLLVIEDTIETVDTMFSLNLHISAKQGVGISFLDAALIASSGQDILTMEAEGWSGLSYTMTSPKNMIDLSATVSSPPSKMIGTWVISNNSDPSIDAKPFVGNIGSEQLFEADTIVHIMNSNLNSYFDFDLFDCDTFVMVSGTSDPVNSLKVSGDGKIGYLVIGNDMASASVPCDLISVTVNRFKSFSSIGGQTISITDGAILSGGAPGDSPVISLNSISSKCLASFMVNCVIICLGNQVDVQNCNISGINLAGNGGTGNFNLTNNQYAGPVFFGNPTNRIIDTNGVFNGLLTITDGDISALTNSNFIGGAILTGGSNTSFINPTFGVAGAVFPDQKTLTINSGVLNTTIQGGTTNLPIVDNGTGTQISPSLNIF